MIGAFTFRATFRQLLVAGDREAIYPVLKWVLPQPQLLEKRAFVGYYLSFPDVSCRVGALCCCHHTMLLITHASLGSSKAPFWELSIDHDIGSRLQQTAVAA
jgi:Intraflagellar transport 81 calponin homology domain